MKTLFVKKAAALAAFAALSACSAPQATPDTSDAKFDAAHSVALDVTIDAGRIISPSTDPSVIKSAIIEQLYYTIGQLNGRTGGATDMSRTKLSLGQPVARADGLYDVTYEAKLFVAWPREQAVPETYEFILPARGDWQGLNVFFQKYGADEHGSKLCLAWETHDVSQSILWYYYRPLKSSCDLTDPALDDPAIVARVQAKFALSGENTEGKAPEYDKVWEDGVLYATAIFGKNEYGATANYDAGISAFRELYSDLISKFGEPTSSNLAEDAEPSATNDDVRLTFDTPQGVLDVHLYLVDEIRSVDQDFKDRYNARTKISDFVSYSGHSGLGANIRALARMGQFVTGQYQIFMVNGCDTFAYVDNALRDAHQVANPDFGPSKYFDIITNAMPSYFHMNATSNMALINALVSKTQTYREILSGFDQYQRATVTGEEDNVWPLPFGG